MLLFTFVVDDGTSKSPTYKKLDIDEGLFRRIGASDMVAFDELYQLTERTLYAYALSLTKNHEETLDLIQETYVKVLSAAHLYKPMGKPLAWLFTITKNLYLSQLRKDKRIVYMEDQQLSNNSRFSYITDPEDKMVLETALQHLTDEESQIVLLHAVTGMKHKEIASNLGLGLSTTLSKYHRAIKKLRSQLEEKEGAR
ncbi:RNA polymerase sigma factor [Petrocella sp. FN5]|uniref:RNA polymerase sigma factor n=1 Tax=Petrocella sp. FN5 TaxID=3032002 RepID=UPI0023DA6579|nr:RNA polymerase sigma factor [Petrocella sp. FN5]MDF1618191.1 RNA polymerase sigma factor [Petrocella sp. FN5]